jgi:hypothetical protein
MTSQAGTGYRPSSIRRVGEKARYLKVTLELLSLAFANADIKRHLENRVLIEALAYV